MIATKDEIEGAVELVKEGGHHHLGEICELKDGEFYDVEEWTPIAGGNYIGTYAIKITKEECQYWINKEKEDSYIWSTSNHWFPWRNSIRIRPHVKYRRYICVDHETKCPSGVYDLKNWDNTIAQYKLMHFASKDYSQIERIFSKEDLDSILKDEVNKKLRNIFSKLTVKQQEELQKGINRLPIGERIDFYNQQIL